MFRILFVFVSLDVRYTCVFIRISYSIYICYDTTVGLKLKNSFCQKTVYTHVHVHTLTHTHLIYILEYQIQLL